MHGGLSRQYIQKDFKDFNRFPSLTLTHAQKNHNRSILLFFTQSVGSSNQAQTHLQPALHSTSRVKTEMGYACDIWA
jgi:hypothetical protein